MNKKFEKIIVNMLAKVHVGLLQILSTSCSCIKYIRLLSNYASKESLGIDLRYISGEMFRMVSGSQG